MSNVILIVCLAISLFNYLMVAPAVAEETAMTETIEKVEYTLPWPGILPDHPLYFLKVLRDRVWGFLVRDPLKKAEWALLMADKRVWAGQMLVKRGKEALGVTTLKEAEKFLEMAMLKAEEARVQGGNGDPFLEKLSRSSLKHKEVLDEVLSLVSEESQGVIRRMIECPEKIYEQTQGLRE